MKNTHGLLLMLISFTATGSGLAASGQAEERGRAATGLVAVVRNATQDFQEPAGALPAGYVSSGSCVTGPEEGAMGVHYPNPELIEDGQLHASRPEILVYEPRGDRLRLAGVEYIVLAEDWHATHAAPPVLMGQHFHYVGSPNRYGLPPFYELHVWAWRHNPHGMFVDWNPQISCEDYTGQDITVDHGHGSH